MSANDSRQETSSLSVSVPLYLLIEIVSVNLLLRNNPNDADSNSRSPNLYVTITTTDQLKVHQTAVIQKNHCPIYTCQTGSLYLLPIYEHDIHGHSFSCSSDDAVESTKKIVQVTFGIWDKDVMMNLKDTCLGQVSLDKSTLLQGDASRQEYDILPVMPTIRTTKSSKMNMMTRIFRPVTIHPKDTQDSIGTLALRYRIAQEYEIDFMADMIMTGKIRMGVPENSIKSIARKPKVLLNHASQIMTTSWDTILGTFRPSTSSSTREDHKWSIVSDKSFMNALPRKQRKDRYGRVEYLVKPYPDPKNLDGTKWLTKDEFNAKALESSSNWIQMVGHEKHDLGSLFLEIIQVSNMPNLDTGQLVGDVTDAFIGAVFEDNIVRTDVIDNELSPRFMPWTQRAFIFPIKHPSSLLFLGVFDYDVLGNHDPVGRVVVDLNNFHPDTVYLLDYKLRYLADQSGLKDDRGTLRIRLRLEWKHNRQNVFQIYAPLPKIMVNVPDERSFKIVRYLCTGRIHSDKPSIPSCKAYMRELLSYKDQSWVFLDAIISTILWRGTMQIGTSSLHLSLWFPVDSILVFLAGIIANEQPFRIPSLVFLSIAYIMFKSGYNSSKNPYPWMRTKSPIPFVRNRMMTYVEHQGYLEYMDMKRMKKMRIERLKILCNAIKEFKNAVQREYVKLDYTYYLVSTEEKRLFKFNATFLIDDYVSYLQQVLESLCYQLRVAKSILTWKSYNISFVIMTRCLIVGVLLSIVPIAFILRWTGRILVFTFFGPWMKIIDVCFVQPYYPIHTEETDLKEYKDWITDKVLNASSKINKISQQIRLAEEEGVKLKAMKELRFGSFTEEVRVMDTGRYFYYPEATSTARPYYSQISLQEYGYRYQSLESVDVRKLSGQRLYGSMIPHTQLELVDPPTTVTSIGHVK